MKLNNKGFSLVELLAVLALLITIISIAIPSLSSTLARSENKELEEKKKLITSSVEISVNKNDSYYSDLKNNLCSFSVEKIISLGFITEEIGTDNDGNVIKGCVEYKDNKYQFVDSECKKECISK